MMEAIVWALSQSIKVIGIIGAWYLFKAIVSNGSDTVKDLIDTMAMGIQAGCYHLKRVFWEKIKKERAPVTEQETAKAEGSVR